VTLAYGPDGRSRGEATVLFGESTKAAEALKKFNGVKVDNRPMRVGQPRSSTSGTRR
jgi:THO complex subunit 4